jgi:hypothetical protein
MNAPVPEDTLAAIEAALRQGRKIDAIKLYRQCTGAGLAEAKAAVESWRPNHALDQKPPLTLETTWRASERPCFEEIRLRPLSFIGNAL